MNVPEALRAIETLLSDPGDLLSPDTGPGGLWEDGDENAPFWSEAGLYGRVGKEAARTILYRHRKATEALRVLRGASEDVPAALARPDLSPLPCPGRRRAMTPGADLAAARKEAEKALEDYDADAKERALLLVRGPISLRCIHALRSLLAASPEPSPEPVSNAYTLPDEVREAAEMLNLTIRMRETKHSCADRACSNVAFGALNLLAALGGRS